ncbi:3'(2'),5'-bisphosphate nucleotidase CysQ [bacterium]|nr:3'(2'),5'-bisphosphate nucleotidase CysQ [bacterium]
MKRFSLSLSDSGPTLWKCARDAATHAAISAWGVIASYYNGSYMIEEKAEGPTTEADRAADLLISERLSRCFPRSHYGYLTEESDDSDERLDRDRVWIIDPIDGTRDFINHTDNFAIHIALVECSPDDRLWHPVAAVVYLPMLGRLYSAIRGGGAYRQLVPHPPQPSDWANHRRPIQVSTRTQLQDMRSVVSNANRTSRLMRLIHSLNLENYWHVGSLGVKLSIIAEGDAELYINLALGKSKEWDIAAPHLILAEAGGTLTDLNGAPISYNKPDVYNRAGLLATNGPAHHAVLDRIHRFLESEQL